MSYQTIDAERISRMFRAGAANLEAEKDLINELNVFPVPDGDTGSNMTMTIMAAVEAVNAVARPDMKEIAKAISGGSLRGARGNSGVILSQLCRGFTKVIRDHREIDAPLMAEACEKAVETAYKAVMKPKEGTILTVARAVAERAAELAGESGAEIASVMRGALDYGSDVLDQTPEMLPVLKEAGVVDSGGKGLLTILEGAYAELTGRFDPDMLETAGASGKPAAVFAEESGEAIQFGYCTEFIINRKEEMKPAEVTEFREFLEGLGDSLVLVSDEDLVKVHVHTNDPGAAISKALTYGSLTNMKIDNMRFEHHEKVIRDAARLAKEQAEEAAKPVELKETGFIAVCAGEGFRSIFTELNVDYVISGGQTMNPSTDDFLNAIKEVPAKNIFIFPNNSNIILAANQARELTEEKNIIVIPTKTVPQAITAMINYVPDAAPEENADVMCEMITSVRTAQITYSIRDTSLDNIEIHKDDIMAVGDGGIICAGTSIQEVAEQAAASMVTPETELISIYYGADYDEEAAGELADRLAELYPDCDVEVNEGGQPVYYCIISAE